MPQYTNSETNARGTVVNAVLDTVTQTITYTVTAPNKTSVTVTAPSADAGNKSTNVAAIRDALLAAGVDTGQVGSVATQLAQTSTDVQEQSAKANAIAKSTGTSPPNETAPIPQASPIPVEPITTPPATAAPAAQADPNPPPATAATTKTTDTPAAQAFPFDEQTEAPPPPITTDAPAAQAFPFDEQNPEDLAAANAAAELNVVPKAARDPYLTSDQAVTDAIIDEQLNFVPKAAKDPYLTSDQAVDGAITDDVAAMSPKKDPRVGEGRELSTEQIAQISKEVTLQKARDQTSLSQQRKQANDGDWRFKLSLAPNSTYLYKAAALEQLDAGQVSAAGIMQPLLYTDGVIFPYTPTISTAYRANYTPYDLTHSNYRGYFYQNSAVEEISLTGTFTAQDTTEANYLLAVIHFFRSVTKMFYGATDPMRGAPPPVCFLSGLGQYQFNYHPVLVSNFSYNLPNDVDYIRAGSVSNNGTNLTDRRDRGIAAPTTTTAVLGRLLGIKAPQGGMTKPPPPATLQINSPTYVPTKMDISLTLLPIQSRSDISKIFNLQQYASGSLLKGGFW